MIFSPFLFISEMEKKEEDCAHGLEQQEWYWANASKEEIASAIGVSLGLVIEIIENCADHIWVSFFLFREIKFKSKLLSAASANNTIFN